MSEPEGPWVTEQIECESCGWEWVSVHPACERVECPTCKHLTKTYFLEREVALTDREAELTQRVALLVSQRDQLTVLVNRYRDALERICNLPSISGYSPEYGLAYYALHLHPNP